MTEQKSNILANLSPQDRQVKEKSEKSKNPKIENQNPRQSDSKRNPMREIKIEKVVLSVGGIAEDLEKGVKLLNYFTQRKSAKIKSKKRIPSLGVRPGLEIGAVVTIRKNTHKLLKRLLTAIDNTLNKKQISENNFSFGIKEYIEIPGTEYQRDIGIIGFDVTIVFKRTGRRVKLRKIKKGRIPKRQIIAKEEIIKFMEDNFQTSFE